MKGVETSTELVPFDCRFVSMTFIPVAVPWMFAVPTANWRFDDCATGFTDVAGTSLVCPPVQPASAIPIRPARAAAELKR
jgi:hypothetical protein